MELNRTAKQAMWMSNFIREVDLGLGSPLQIHSDSFGAVSLCQEARKHSVIKHIDVKNFYIRERVAGGDIVVTQIRTGDNVADIFTKPLNGTVHLKLVRMLGLERTE